MTNSEKFIKEYDTLCEKYNMDIQCVAPDMYAVLDREEYNMIRPMSKEDWEDIENRRHENEAKRKAEEDAKRKVQFEEAKKRHLAHGGTLNDDGSLNIPPADYSLINVFGQ